MNQELKNLISTLFDGEKVVVDLVKKNYVSVIMDGLAVLNDAPGDISGFSDLFTELKALSNPANVADLISFIQKKLAPIFPQLSSAKAVAIISAIEALINSAMALEKAFVS